ncbi:MAG: hypothetical protein IKF17_04145 [Clostridia bacterium]|nr:hypothetical protein [Clostridia bacterium]
MEDDNNNVNVLDEINKGTTMGMDAIEYVSEKVGDPQFRDVLNIEYNKYSDISKRINEIYHKYATKEPHETSKMNKMMTWYGIQMNTINDKSNSKISELLMQGTNMGIIEGRRLINQNQNGNINEEVKQLLCDFVTMQKDSVETLKKYL